MTTTLPSISARPLGEMLLRRGSIRADQLDRALAEQRRCKHRKLLGEILVDLQDCTEQQVAEALAEAYGIPFAAVNSRLADPKVLSVLPRDFVERHLALPLFLVDGVLTVAIAEPANVFLLEEIERLGGRPVQVVAATARDIRATLRAYMPGDDAFAIDPLIEDVRPGSFSFTPPLQSPAPAAAPASVPVPAPGPRFAPRRFHTRLAAATALPALPALPAAQAARSPADKLLIFCLYSALKEGATAVHFEPAAETVRVRFRLDGVLAEKMHPPMRLHEALAARLKSAAGLDPAQCRVPQHGRLRASFDGKPVDLEIATAPGRYGEKLVIRFVESEKPAVRLEKLGFGYDMLKQWRRLLSLPSGLILVTGPADSGKGTTLYSSLESRNAPGANLCTIEDPIRHALPGVNQFQVDPTTGFTPEAALEAVLRQEPDVLMVCDLPDAATARLAARAALAGRLVLAGLQANDAPLALNRLPGLGLEPYLVASSVSAVLSQRLVRKLCQSCKEPYEPAGAEKRQIEKSLPGITILYRPKGCDRCRHLGYAGRIGLFELLVPDDDLMDHLGQGAPLGEIRRLAKAAGMTSLRTDGLEKAKAGITTLEEIYRVTG